MRVNRPSLPESLAPILAKIGEAFVSDDHLFEIKWDGIRTLALIENQVRLFNRKQVAITEHYPDLNELDGFPPGTILDGEIVVLRDGLPDFSRLMSRHHLVDPRRIRVLAKTAPVTYVVFDLLYVEGKSIMDLPLSERRRQLEELFAGQDCSRVVVSDGITGDGVSYFKEVCDLSLEGMMAKRLGSRYHPGKRSDAWLKVKRSHELACVIIGYVPSKEFRLRSLIIAVPDESGALSPVGRVGSGIDDATRERLTDTLEGMMDLPST